MDSPTPNERPAILGGVPIRSEPMPPRLALGDAEEHMIKTAIAYYRGKQIDPGYQGHFEKLYTDAFVQMMGGGYADAVATGTSAIYVALAALDLPKGSSVLVSPITDPGSISAIILNGLKPKLVDSRPGNFNIGLEQFKARIGPDVSAALLVHSIGQACDVERIVAEAHAHGIKVVEDCSQSHGAKVGGRVVGTFGDAAAFSTMYRKAHMTGASGGVVYSRDLEIFRQCLAHADRGKPRWLEGFNDRDPNTFLFPALNHHTDEISCAVGLASVARLADTIVRRLSFVSDFTSELIESAQICTPYGYSPSDSPFIYPVIVDRAKITCTKTEFALAVEKEGIGLNPHYQYLVVDWGWVKPHLADTFETKNAREIRDSSFALYLNENYGPREAQDAVAAICKIERHYGIAP